jgi:hypothetical protein
MIASVCRLRQVDIKAEHFERQLSRAVEERDAMEKKYDVSLDWATLFRPHLPNCSSRSTFDVQETLAKLNESKSELDKLVQGLDSLVS